MEKYWAAAVIAGMCVLVLGIGALRSRAEWLLNFLLRACLGVLAIYVCNQLLASRGLGGAVGINLLTVLTSGTLGFPGVALLYGINFYSLL